jgi:hypothetical protein
MISPLANSSLYGFRIFHLYPFLPAMSRVKKVLENPQISSTPLTTALYTIPPIYLVRGTQSILFGTVLARSIYSF